MYDQWWYDTSYKPGPPNEEVGLMDAEIAEKCPCSNCGGQCHYEAAHREGSYLAFAVCNDCGYSKEF